MTYPGYDGPAIPTTPKQVVAQNRAHAAWLERGRRDRPKVIHEPLTLTPKELQEALRLSKQSIIRLLQSGELRSFTVGRRARRVLRSDFEQYIARRLAVNASKK